MLLDGTACRGIWWVLPSVTQEIDTFCGVHMDVIRITQIKGLWNIHMADLFHNSDKQWILLVEACGLELMLTSMTLHSVISHVPWVKTDQFKQAITSMASSLFKLLLTGMFGYVKGCLISLCLHKVSLRVTTLCTAGTCLASKVKPGSLWNLTKASSLKGWKFTLIWRLQSFLFGHTQLGQRQRKPVFFLHPCSCKMN